MADANIRIPAEARDRLAAVHVILDETAMVAPSSGNVAPDRWVGMSVGVLDVSP